MKRVNGIKINFNEQKQRFSLTLLLAAVVFAVLLVALLLAAGLIVLMVQLGMFGKNAEDITLSQIVIAMGLISLTMGAALVFLLGKFPLQPINKLVNGMNSLAAGNYKTRIKFGGPLWKHPTFNEITKSFNTLAKELESTELLRSDFINNFSHEFKTPIVSISGFAKLLKRGGLSAEQERQYLAAIEEEANRLSYMATNVLNMTKIDNLTILTDVTEFNLSEQIRSAILLLEEKWEKKNIELQIDFDEYTIEASEELLKQVWINLVDNAVKFVPRCGTVALDISEDGDDLKVSISNTGADIPPQKLGKIFNKFYQADESHASEGNGIGLAIVERVVKLHCGDVSVKSGGGMTTFTVILPKRQSYI